jgi:hypothetical protein
VITFDHFNQLSEDDRRSLIAEFDGCNITGIPTPGSRKWYLLEFTHWMLGEILQGRNPIPD